MFFVRVDIYYSSHIVAIISYENLDSAYFFYFHVKMRFGIFCRNSSCKMTVNVKFIYTEGIITFFVGITLHYLLN